MTSKLLRAIGIFAVIALIGGSFAALAVVESRLHITVQEDEAAAQRGPDALAFLTSDVGAVRGHRVRHDERRCGGATVRRRTALRADEALGHA